MPFLSGEDREAHAKRTERECPHCKQHIHQAYCSRCDEFYDGGHKADCPAVKQTNIIGEEHGIGPGKCGGDRGFR